MKEKKIRSFSRVVGILASVREWDKEKQNLARLCQKNNGFVARSVSSFVYIIHEKDLNKNHFNTKKYINHNDNI